MACWCKGQCPIAGNIKDLARSGRNSEAERTVKLALLDAPNCVEANLALAGILTHSNRSCFATVHLQRAIKTGGDTVKAGLAAAHTARSNLQLPAAIGLYRTVIETDANNVEAYAGLVSALEANGELDDAEEVSSVFVSKFPDDQDAISTKALVQAARKDFAGAVATLSAQKNLRPMDMLARGRYHDRAGDYDSAWKDWTRAKNMLVRRGRAQFEQRAFNERIAALGALASKKRLAYVQKQPWPPIPEKRSPIFVTGFPRSGTTMTETAIAAHPDILAGDELPFLSEAMNMMQGVLNSPTPYPAAMLASDFGENIAGFALLRSWYLHRARYRLNGGTGDGPLTGKKFFTDKMPLNEMHLPAIMRLFPEAPVFHVRRHPLDVIVSNMSYYFQHGWGYGSSLRAVAGVYAGVDSLVAQYHQIFPGKLYTVRYEKFVANHQYEIDLIFGHIGLKPDPQSYDFHATDRLARTVSHRQIKEPVYDRSIGRYKNYLTQLAPILDQITPILEREGYEL